VAGPEPVSGGRLSDQGFAARALPNTHISQTQMPVSTRWRQLRAPGSAGVDLPLQSLLYELPVATTRDLRDQQALLLKSLGEPRLPIPQNDRTERAEVSVTPDKKLTGIRVVLARDIGPLLNPKGVEYQWRKP
jgi:hypothetical protein